MSDCPHSLQARKASHSVSVDLLAEFPDDPPARVDVRIVTVGNFFGVLRGGLSDSSCGVVPSAWEAADKHPRRVVPLLVAVELEGVVGHGPEAEMPLAVRSFRKVEQAFGGEGSHGHCQSN